MCELDESESESSSTKRQETQPKITNIELFIHVEDTFKRENLRER